jgi:hypothetical protein
MNQRVTQTVNFFGKSTDQGTAGAAGSDLGTGVNQVGNGFRLGQIDLLNDKIDLAQAEAIADLIDASTEVAARSATRRPASRGTCRTGSSSAPASMQRANKSCNTTGPPWACNSSTSSPVNE